MQKQIPFIKDPLERRELLEDAEEMEQFETAIVAYADYVVCLSEDEAAFVRRQEGRTKCPSKFRFSMGLSGRRHASQTQRHYPRRQLGCRLGITEL